MHAPPAAADREFFEPEHPALDRWFGEALDASEERTGLAGPTRVLIGRHDVLPLVGWRVQSLDRRGRPDFYEEAMLVGVCRDDGRVAVARAFDPPGVLEDPPELDGDPPDGVSGAPFEFDAFERLGLPRVPAVYEFIVIARDQVSGRAVVRVEHDPHAFHDAEVEDYFRRQRDALPPEAPMPPPSRSTAYGVSPEADVPAGLTLATERVLQRHPDAPWMLRGTLRVPSAPREVVRARPEPPAHDPYFGAAAVTPVSIVITGPSLSRAYHLTLQVPCFDLVTGDSGAPVAVGSFALDLLQFPGTPRLPGTYFIYAFAGGAMTGPAVTARVDPR